MSELFSVLENLGLKILFPSNRAHYRASYYRVQKERLLSFELIAACLAGSHGHFANSSIFKLNF